MIKINVLCRREEVSPQCRSLSQRNIDIASLEDKESPIKNNSKQEEEETAILTTAIATRRQNLMSLSNHTYSGRISSSTSSSNNKKCFDSSKMYGSMPNLATVQNIRRTGPAVSRVPVTRMGSVRSSGGSSSLGSMMTPSNVVIEDKCSLTANSVPQRAGGR